MDVYRSLASRMAWRREPPPESAVLVTEMAVQNTGILYQGVTPGEWYILCLAYLLCLHCLGVGSSVTGSVSAAIFILEFEDNPE